eukprot:scaffold19324_cov152-Cylindrotheca_fusiformis.AAC.7
MTTKSGVFTHLSHAESTISSHSTMRSFVSAFLLFHVASSLNGLVPSSLSVRQNSITSPSTRLDLYASTQEAIAEAQRVCAMYPNSEQCKVAWDIVEELEAADSHRINANTQSAPQQGSTNMSPDLVALVNSFDILAKKIDSKMDHLKATIDKLQELGADDPAVAELGTRADDMKQIMAYVNDYLRRQV